MFELLDNVMGLLGGCWKVKDVWTDRQCFGLIGWMLRCERCLNWSTMFWVCWVVVDRWKMFELLDNVLGLLIGCWQVKDVWTAWQCYGFIGWMLTGERCLNWSTMFWVYWVVVDRWKMFELLDNVMSLLAGWWQVKDVLPQAEICSADLFFTDHQSGEYRLP